MSKRKNNKDNNKIGAIKKMKLATKIALAISAMLILIFGILITFTLVSTQNAISKNIAAEFNALAKANGLQVQDIIDAATDTTLDIENYILKECEKEKKGAAVETVLNSAAIKNKYISSVYNVEVNEFSNRIEEYMLETARNAVKINENIEGIGAMFEPYMVSKNIESYAFYINRNDVDAEVKPYEVYSNYSTKGYYKGAAEQKQFVFTEPYKLKDLEIVTASNPVIYNDKLYGVVMADVNVTSFNRINSKSDRYPSMYAIIYDDKGVIIYNSENVEKIGKKMSEFLKNAEIPADIQEKQAKGEAFQTEIVREGGRKVTCFFNPITAGNSTWWAVTALETKDMYKSVIMTTIAMIIISIIALIVIVLIITAVLKKMLAPINGVVKAAEDISNGNFDICLTANSDDEIGVLTRTFDNTAKTLRLVITDISNVLNNLSNKNFNVDTSANYVGDLEQIENSMKNIICNLNEVMGNINESAEQVSSGSEQVSSSGQALSQGASEQASAIEELSATILEISEQIKQNAENAKTANIESTNTGNEILKSNEQMQEMINAIEEINDKSNQIGKIIKTIEDIAFQTNILALNAAVEAARAGSAGKGFAVVAEEVRNLASKSAEAAKNTTALIEGTVNAVDIGTKIARITADSMLSLVEGAKKVTDIVDEIAKASENQAASIEQVTLGVEQIASVVQNNSATAEESAAASEELSGQAQMLKEMVEQFRLKN